MSNCRFLFLVLICFSTIGVLSYVSKVTNSSGADTIVPKTMPQLLTRVDTKYPHLARVAGIVGIKFSVDKKGRVLNSEIIRSTDSKAGLEEATLESSRKNLWIPAYSERGPITYWSYYEVIFIHRTFTVGQTLPYHDEEDTLFGNHKTSSNSAIEIHAVYDTPPTIDETVAVHYTGETFQENMEGSLWLRLIVSELGKVENVLILHSSLNDTRLEHDLVSALYDYIYVPAMYQGRPVASQIECELVFGQVVLVVN
jgi:hypothetical protein